MLIFYSPHQREHRPDTFLAGGAPRAHPDVPERLDALLSGVEGSAHDIVEPRDHGLSYVALVHSERYLEFLSGAHAAWRQLPAASTAVAPNVHPRRAAGDNYPSSIVGRAGYHLYDMSCPIGEPTWRAVLWNSHSASEAALRVAQGTAASAYAMCRPPGHHAGPDYAGGFCYLNNAAIAASILRREFARVAVLDVDVHHCNGTQEIFYDRADVVVVSLHGDPADFYPFFWGYAGETGAGEGLGSNLNMPLPRGLGDEEYLERLEAALQSIRASGASALVVSLGFDAYERDPLSWLKITTDGFRRIGSAVAALGLPTVLVQEGGYFCPDLGRNLAAFLLGFETNHSTRRSREWSGG
ncbi:MAG TPA: histone deacetylase family protein [Steroidobacteraceae bacterium]|jgi:acetoin utilization deacetylase AcuC-like enzyme|nr:histone deacetylase family protein [Steroidobacteraceae bacterium]